VLVWVTGISGAGKSTVCQALRRRGHLAVDADSDGYCYWVHTGTGETVHPPDPPPAGWFEHHTWRISTERVAELAARADGGLVFLCGAVENEREVWDLFDLVICLVVDDATVRYRLAARTTNSFGQRPEELKMVLTWNPSMERRYAEFGATIIDATQPLEVVVEQVLATVAA
jgi:dephospho-CoA kinase